MLNLGEHAVSDPLEVLSGVAWDFGGPPGGTEKGMLDVSAGALFAKTSLSN